MYNIYGKNITRAQYVTCVFRSTQSKERIMVKYKKMHPNNLKITTSYSNVRNTYSHLK